MDKQDIFDNHTEPLLLYLSHAVKQNTQPHKLLWSGKSIQLHLMSIPPDGEAEASPDSDRLLYIEEGRGLIKLWQEPNGSRSQKYLIAGNTISIPAGRGHILRNVGSSPLKLYCISALPR